MTGLRVVSYGGGVQSTALLVLAAQRRIDYPIFLMANVGDDTEHPATLDYVHQVAVPYAAANGIDLHLLHKTRLGATETLLQRIDRDTAGSGNVAIPMRAVSGAPFKRNCTETYKIEVLARWLKDHGATGGKPCRQHKEGAARPDCSDCVQPNRAVVGMGISLDEIHRANPDKDRQDYRVVTYPLISLGDETGLRLRRDDCQRIIADAGLPVPPKSSCYFCPFHRLETWQEMRRAEPDLFAKSADMEEAISARRVALGKEPVFLTRLGIPLRQAIQGDAQGVLFTETGLSMDDDGECDSGVCFT